MTKPIRMGWHVDSRNITETIECACCGKEIPKDGPTKRVCAEKCQPKPDFRQKCVRCGEEKGYEGFYDYRGQHGNGKLHTVCKACKRGEQLSYYHENRDMILEYQREYSKL